MFLILAFCALSAGSATWTLGSGTFSTQYWAGNFNNASFFGQPATWSEVDGTSHFSPMVIPSATVDTFLQPAGAPGLNITKSIEGNFLDKNWFYNFPFAPGTSCGGTVCPDVGPNAITTPVNGAKPARAAFVQNRDSVWFDFASPIGAFGISFAFRSTDGSSPTVSVSFGTPSTTTHRATFVPAVGGEMSYIWFEPTVDPLHTTTITRVNFTFTNLPDIPNVPNQGGWMVFNEVYFGQTGYGCVDEPTRTSALTINLLNLPVATSISYDGDLEGTISAPSWIDNVGNQKVIICVRPGLPVISVKEGGYIFRSHIDSTLPIICGTGHFAQLSARCSLDPRSVLTIPTPCIPSASDPVTLSLHSSGATTSQFRSDLVLEDTATQTYYVLASQFVSARLNVLTLQTPDGSIYTCRKSNQLQGPGTCTVATRRGNIAKPLEFRIQCAEPTLPAAPIPNRVRVNVTIRVNPSYSLQWLLDNVENSDQELCVPAFGTFIYNAREYGINEVTTDDANANCSPNSQSTRCNTTPLDLVSVLHGPGVCTQFRDCNGAEAEAWVGGSDTLGFPLSLSQNGVLFRTFNQHPFEQISRCVLNLNEVQLAAHIETLNPVVGTTLHAAYDCTRTQGATPGPCAQKSGNPAQFFDMLAIEAGSVPGLTYRIDYTYTSEEDGTTVCSTGTLANGIFCSNSSRHVCVPAIGSAPVTPECGAAYLPERIEVVAQECPGGACFTQAADACRPDYEKCIRQTFPLDCRTGCSAKLYKELCLWDLLALPEGSQTVELRGANTNYNDIVRTTSQLGGAPYSTHVIATSMRITVVETGTPFQIGDLIHCDAEGDKCFYNDFLSIIDLSQPLVWNGENRLAGVSVKIVGSARDPISVGKDAAKLCKPVVLLGGNPYFFTYTWNGVERTVTSVCIGCPLNSCTPIESLVRRFAVDPTVPSQEAYNTVVDGVGQVVQQDVNGRFKSYGNPWAGALEVSVNQGASLEGCKTTYDGVICRDSNPNQEPLAIYYVLSPDRGTNIDIKVAQGCQSEVYTISCGFNVADTPIASCGASCTNSTEDKYSYFCEFVGSAVQTGPAQNSQCAVDSCHAAWFALRPYVNTVVDLRCFPDGSSDISSTPPPSGSFNQNMYRGANYTDFYGQVTARQNPIDIRVCCGSRCPRNRRNRCRLRDGDGEDKKRSESSYCQSPLPPGTDCDYPLLLTEAGGYQNVFTSLYHQQVGQPLVISVQELYRSESKTSWEEVRPYEVAAACADESFINWEWRERIVDVRPTVCSSTTPVQTVCGPSKPNTICSYVYGNEQFASVYEKGQANNELALGQLKYTYSLIFQSECYRQPQDPVAWNVVRAHTLLRPNGFAAPSAEFCVVKDNFYGTALNDELIRVTSPPANCSPRRRGPRGESSTYDYCQTTVGGNRPIPFQGVFFKKDTLFKEDTQK